MIMFNGEQGQRSEGDGKVEVKSPEDDRFVIVCEQDGVETHVVMSRFNAWRAFGMLALMLGIKLSANLGKKIVL